MSLTILEDRKIWGSIPREIVTGIWIFWLGVGAGAISGTMLLKVTFYLRALPDEAYEDPTPPEVSN
jgi:hypothetical protein